LLIDSSWNFNADIYYPSIIETNEYQIRLAWASEGFDSIKLSNGGFYVCELDPRVLGDFPKGFIAGEINVSPGFVDLNLSRDDLVDNNKIDNLRKIIGDCIVKLFFEYNKLILTQQKSNTPPDTRLKKMLDAVIRGAMIANTVCSNKIIGKIPLSGELDPRALYESAVILSLAQSLFASKGIPISEGSRFIRSRKVHVVDSQNCNEPLVIDETYFFHIRKRSVIIFREPKDFEVQMTDRRAQVTRIKPKTFSVRA
jgi:hypothetical protein